MARRGIPTEYSGIRFRSRLEATWAAFFDLMQWPGRVGHDSYDRCVWCGVGAWDFSKGVDAAVDNVVPLDANLVHAAWATAKNRVQWRGEFGA